MAFHTLATALAVTVYLLASVCVFVWMVFDDDEPWRFSLAANMACACITVLIWPIALACTWSCGERE